MESQSLNIFLIFYSSLIGLTAITLVILFWMRTSKFQEHLNSMKSDLSEAHQFKQLTAQTIERLSLVFARIPAMARCYQIFQQSLICPQPPHTQFYRSSRDAVLTFDRTYILKHSLSLNLFQTAPGALISLGVLGTIIAFAYCVKNAAPLFSQTDVQSLSTVVENLFSFGAKSFWPAGCSLVSALLIQMVIQIQAQSADETLQSLVTNIDAIITPTNIEQISSQSLVELRLQHETINGFTKEFYSQMQGVLEGLARSYVAPLTKEIENLGEKYLTQIRDELSSISQSRGQMERAMLELHTGFLQASADRATEHREALAHANRLNDDLNTGLSHLAGTLQNLELATQAADSHRRDEMNELIKSIGYSVDSLYDGFSRFAESSIQQTQQVQNELRHTVMMNEKFLKSEFSETQREMQTQFYKMNQELQFIESDVSKMVRATFEMADISRDVRDIGDFLENVPLSTVEIVHVPRAVRGSYRKQNDDEDERNKEELRKKNSDKVS